MRILLRHLSIFSLFTLLQSCVVYHKTPVSLEQAAKAGAKAKIVMADGSPVKYKYITEINGNFYGVNKKSGVWIKTPVKTSPNTQVFLKDESASRWFTWGLIMAPPLALGLFVASVCILIGPCY